MPRILGASGGTGAADSGDEVEAKRGSGDCISAVGTSTYRRGFLDEFAALDEVKGEDPPTMAVPG
jgi:hypothetical protein